jgi:HEPN domain-containing protein
MTKHEKFEYWLETAEYDLETADAMLNNGRWLYVLFMCQQAIEKLVKGLYVLYVDDDVPRIHNIRVLIDGFEHLLPEKMTDEHCELFEDLTIYYISGRYTDYKQKLSEKINKLDAHSSHGC